MTKRRASEAHTTAGGCIGQLLGPLLLTLPHRNKHMQCSRPHVHLTCVHTSTPHSLLYMSLCLSGLWCNIRWAYVMVRSS